MALHQWCHANGATTAQNHMSVLPTPLRENRRANADCKVSMVVPSQPWQGAPAARAPLHPHRQTGLSESPSACPDACDAGRGNAFGDRRSRCNVWPLHHQSGGAFLLPRHPHDQGETSLSPGPHRPTLCGLDAHHRSRRCTASRGVPAPCNPASVSSVDR